MSFNTLFDRIELSRIVVPENYLYVKHKKNTCDAVRLTGIMVPLVVLKDGDRYLLLDGLERLQCAKELGWKSVPAIVTEDLRTDIIRMALNYVRGRVCGIDVLFSTWQLLQSYSPDVVKTILGKSWETLNKYKSVAEHIINLGLSKDDLVQLRESCISVRKLITCAYDAHDAAQFMECVLNKPRPRLKKVTAEAVKKAIQLEKNPELREAVDLVEMLGTETTMKIIEITDVIKKTLCSRMERYKKCLLIEDYKLLKKLCGES